jgi:hypothetical protein
MASYPLNMNKSSSSPVATHTQLPCRLRTHTTHTSLVPEGGGGGGELLYKVHYRNHTNVPGAGEGERKSGREGALTFLKNSLEHVAGFSYGFRLK